MPQSYHWGDEAQVDWYEARRSLDGEPRKVYIFCMRSMASGAAFHRAYPHATQQAFLEAHELAFPWFGGVFRTLRFDNLSSAVKKILRGHQREETTRFIAFRSHWGFQAEFCTPGEGHEKGGVEGEGGYFRRNHWVPVPQASDLAELNAKLLQDCHQDEGRLLSGRAESVGALLLQEKEHLLPLPAENFDLAEISFPACQPGRMRQGADELLLRAAQAGHGGGGAGALQRGRVSPRRRVSRSMSAAMAAPRRCWSWNIISTCWSRSPARYQDRNPWRSGGRKADGQPATTSSGSA